MNTSCVIRNWGSFARSLWRASDRPTPSSRLEGNPTKSVRQALFACGIQNNKATSVTVPAMSYLVGLSHRREGRREAVGSFFAILSIRFQSVPRVAPSFKQLAVFTVPKWLSAGKRLEGQACSYTRARWTVTD